MPLLDPEDTPPPLPGLGETLHAVGSVVPSLTHQIIPPNVPLGIPGGAGPASVAPPFYSALGKAVDAAPLSMAPGQQWLGTLRNTPGVKPEELSYTGMQDRLAQPGNISKEDLQSHLADNQLRLGEVWKGGKSKIDLDELSPRQIENLSPAQWDEIRAGQGGATKFGPDTHPTMSLPGGKNYKELLMTLPQKTGEIDDLQAAFDKIYADTPKSAADAQNRSNALSSIVREMELVKNNSRENFRSSHYDEPNILAHMRMNDRVDAAGKKTLFLEEMQSDWHQRGRKVGYDTTEPMFELRNQAGDLESVHFSPAEAEAAKVRMAARFPHMDPAKITGGWTINEISRPTGVPDAPFKHDWHELAMKRAIKHAADNGYDQVAWTPGSVQADRYDLSKQISKVTYGGNHLRAFDHGNREVMSSFVEPKDLPDHIGKDVSEKLLASKEKSVAVKEGGYLPGRELSGLDLRIGGEGMRGFYDKMLPVAANKIGKKFGAQVGTTEIPTTGLMQPKGSDRLVPRTDTVHVLPITPGLRLHAITKGFPISSLENEGQNGVG